MELLVTIAIVSIISAVAVPTYNSYRIKANRSDAITSLLALQVKQERYRLTHDTYGGLADFWGANTKTPDGQYEVSISQISSQSYQLKATALGSQADDDECSEILLTYRNGKITKSPGLCWGLSVNTPPLVN